MIFLLPSTEQFSPAFKTELGSYILNQFPDGEIFLRLDNSIPTDPITVIAATNPPADRFLELFFLLNALQQKNLPLHLIFTYFGYERQDHPKPFVAQGAQVISNCLKQFDLNQITIIHPHSEKLHDYLLFTAFIPYELYCPIVINNNIDVIVAPDNGAKEACIQLAKETKKEFCLITKQRLGPEKVKTLSFTGNVQGKRVLIFDDLISTGTTIKEAVEILKKHGSTAVYALATHSLLTKESLQHLLQHVEHLWITNSISQSMHAQNLTIIDLSPVLQKLVTIA